MPDSAPQTTTPATVILEQPIDRSLDIILRLTGDGRTRQLLIQIGFDPDEDSLQACLHHDGPLLDLHTSGDPERQPDCMTAKPDPDRGLAKPYAKLSHLGKDAGHAPADILACHPDNQADETRHRRWGAQRLGSGGPTLTFRTERSDVRNLS